MLWTSSFPVSRFKLSLSLLVIDLVSYYPTNYLLRNKWIISLWYQLIYYWPVRHFWLACVKILRYPSGGVMIKHLLSFSFLFKELHIFRCLFYDLLSLFFLTYIFIFIYFKDKKTYIYHHLFNYYTTLQHYIELLYYSYLYTLYIYYSYSDYIELLIFIYYKTIYILYILLDYILNYYTTQDYIKLL